METANPVAPNPWATDWFGPGLRELRLRREMHGFQGFY